MELALLARRYPKTCLHYIYFIKCIADKNNSRNKQAYPHKYISRKDLKFPKSKTQWVKNDAIRDLMFNMLCSTQNRNET
jgi:hypothetical protein